MLEQQGLASATSSRSSKLIHGGLRYLESAQFSLVAESLYERELLLKNAPELVRRVPFYIPVYKQTSRRPWQVFVGLSLYALLGRLKAEASFRKLPQTSWFMLDGLSDKDLQAVYQYSDAQTDDAELTRAVMFSACRLGAELICPARFVQAVYSDGRYRVSYQYKDSERELSCTALVNASGPWCNAVQANISPTIPAAQIELVQGTHIVIEQPSPKGIYYVESPGDRRAVFIMPWRGRILVGTTETAFSGDPANVKATEHELDYLSGIVRFYFPNYKSNIVEHFSGLRVLGHSDKSLFHRARDTLFITDKRLPAYIGLVGGKLTGYRSTAEKTLKQIQPYLQTRTPIASTKEIIMPKAPDSFAK